MTDFRINESIERHKTAIPRSSVSAPIFLLQSGGVITDEASVLDYGCGQGDDVRALQKAGIDARGWDPHFKPDPEQLRKCDVVNLGFVLNVIEDRGERVEALRRAFSLAKECLAVSVMLIGKGNLSNSRPYKDGFITSRKTFQKYYSQGEIRDFIAQSLDAAPIAAGQGIFFVFKDEVAEQRFLFRKQIGIRSSATAMRRSSPRSALVTDRGAKGADKTTINRLSEVIRDLGRYPDENELPISLQKRVAASKHSLAYLANLAIQNVDANELDQTVARKSEDISLFFALNAFGQRPPYRELPPELQRDVRAFFGSHQRAIAEGQALLFSIGNSEKLMGEVQTALDQGIGRLDEAKFQFHVQDLARLGPVLRGYVAIGERLAGDLSEATLLKIHIDSKKLTALFFPDFEQSPLPRLERRIKIEFQTFDVQVVDHTTGSKVKLLYERSSYLPEDHPHYVLQKDFDDKIRSIEGLDLSGEGPPIGDFSAAMAKSGIKVPQMPNVSSKSSAF
ncbi:MULTISPECIES: DNA phosphorothioation-associated putative methyltransferase [unclassified Ruegeria]|uniref:DNA phosphorothioation-associated putative methyltransferase n=1 Tax=unclassified Ruegeria TaxID=2625375 RepID=UPI001491AAFD|nr:MULTISPECIES: DNA phosphorothioation-associated putative methyltransferase [unclassified Ruegeria]NOD36642.1 DNA phosphorothioation-associated putative methyltransferase [Ruegeria sp. HKCCD7296]NOE43859.1 DNA phosphorothioation-associated putative methyltransferase [Ruegeria sp. HKCCD7319]